MASGTPDIQQILEQLRGAAAARPATSTPTQGPPSGYPAPTYATQGQYAPPPPAGYPAPPGGFALPQPSSSGSLDLSSIKPVNSGTVSVQEAIARAKAYAVNAGATPYDRPPVYGSSDGRHRNDRSRSPPRRDAHRDGANPYRDERRGYGGGRDSPRGREGAFSPRGRGGSPGRGDDGGSSTETIQIESSLVGLIIGRQGENLRKVEAETQTRVQFVPAQHPTDQYRQCKITGPRSKRQDAKNAINRIIDDSGMSVIARGGAITTVGGDRPKARGPVDAASGEITLKEGEDLMQIMVPDRTVGLIIGRGGETIRDLQDRSGCHINIVGESKSVNGLRPVNLIGSPQATAMAKNLIMEIVDSDSRGASGGNTSDNQQQNYQQPSRSTDQFPSRGMGGGSGKITENIHVPSEAVGMIIGKGGETIREMQNNTGCKINVSQQQRPDGQRDIELIGHRDAIDRAKDAIDEKVDAVGNGSGGGGRGGGGGGRNQYRDYDDGDRGRPNNTSANAGGASAQPVPGADGQNDPYAAYGGYQNYLALWYQSYAAQQAAAGGAGAKPPGQ